MFLYVSLYFKSFIPVISLRTLNVNAVYNVTWLVPFRSPVARHVDEDTILSFPVIRKGRLHACNRIPGQWTFAIVLEKLYSEAIRVRSLEVTARRAWFDLVWPQRRCNMVKAGAQELSRNVYRLFQCECLGTYSVGKTSVAYCSANARWQSSKCTAEIVRVSATNNNNIVNNNPDASKKKAFADTVCNRSFTLFYMVIT